MNKLYEYQHAKLYRVTHIYIYKIINMGLIDVPLLVLHSDDCS